MVFYVKEKKFCSASASTDESACKDFRKSDEDIKEQVPPMEATSNEALDLNFSNNFDSKPKDEAKLFGIPTFPTNGSSRYLGVRPHSGIQKPYNRWSLAGRCGHGGWPRSGINTQPLPSDLRNVYQANNGGLPAPISFYCANNVGLSTPGAGMFDDNAFARKEYTQPITIGDGDTNLLKNKGMRSDLAQVARGTWIAANNSFDSDRLPWKAGQAKEKTTEAEELDLTLKL
ncbi:hypothetical protein IFM89_014416 [Coptis chinensis]|uniref:Uncharacterized protein n=1 Tax=Coptis chinensis TaxID=261450 RepID=A0A835I411_9MAGN|nr:hypothetical protein IFM89_014416 [Coptis chinensis]